MEHRPDPNLFRTLLRHSVFGSVQNKLIQALRDGNTSRTEEELSYELLQAEVEEIQVELLRVLKSSCFSLLQRNNLSGATLVETIYPGSLNVLAKADNLKAVAAGAFDVEAFKEQLNKARPEVWNDLKKAYASLNCLGFRDQDRTDEQVHLALVEGVEHLIALRAQLTRLQDWCARSDILESYRQDKRWFDQHFRRIYLQE